MSESKLKGRLKFSQHGLFLAEPYGAGFVTLGRRQSQDAAVRFGSAYQLQVLSIREIIEAEGGG